MQHKMTLSMIYFWFWIKRLVMWSRLTLSSQSCLTYQVPQLQVYRHAPPHPTASVPCWGHLSPRMNGTRATVHDKSLTYGEPLRGSGSLPQVSEWYLDSGALCQGIPENGAGHFWGTGKNWWNDQIRDSELSHQLSTDVDSDRFEESNVNWTCLLFLALSWDTAQLQYTLYCSCLPSAHHLPVSLLTLNSV